ncbi:MAG TPA: rhodanese-like domain-containing protein [Acidimicrobiales bacterium]|nr:rhodanese-like domain-containing protein [Acidimicrobiales bacterium]
MGLLDDHPFTARLVDDSAGDGARLAVVAITDDGLGNTSWLVDLGGGEALVVDPERDPAPCRRVAERTGTEIALAAETHLHADFVTGSRELAHVELGALTDRADALPSGPLTVMCGHGERAATAASLLAAAGRRDVAVLDGGPADWASATGEALVRS